MTVSGQPKPRRATRDQRENPQFRAKGNKDPRWKNSMRNTGNQRGITKVDGDRTAFQRLQRAPSQPPRHFLHPHPHELEGPGRAETHRNPDHNTVATKRSAQRLLLQTESWPARPVRRAKFPRLRNRKNSTPAVYRKRNEKRAGERESDANSVRIPPTDQDEAVSRCPLYQITTMRG